MRKRALSLGITALLLLVMSLAAQARVTQVIITTVESPTFGGLSFGTVGQYERLVGTIKGEIDPSNPLNAVIVNVDKAPRNSRGNVEYSADLYILRPVDMSKGNGRLFMEVLNRGNKLAPSFYNASTGGNSQQTACRRRTKNQPLVLKSEQPGHITAPVPRNVLSVSA